MQDTSTRPPVVDSDMTDEDHVLLTFGRGLGIVALYSQSWGADVSSDGKVVWFVPSDEPGVDTVGQGDVYDLAEAVDAALAGAEPPPSMITVRLLGMPAQVFATFRTWYSEIRRELRLLSFDADTRFPISDELAELTLQVESERRLARGVDLLNEAIAQDKPSVDLEYHVPATAPATMQRMHEVMLRADRFCRDQSLLTVAATPQQLQLMEWYAGEFVRQGRGEEPLPWPGSTEVEPSTR